MTAPRPAGLPCQSLGLVSDSLQHTPPHLILSVSEPDGECGSNLACSGKWRSGGQDVGLGICYLCCASAYLRGTDTAPNQCRVEKANQMDWPPVPVSGQKQRQIHVDIERRLVTGGSSQGNDASRNHPSTSRCLCLPCLKADGARP